MAKASVHHVVVDGSNIATEGRSTPSLAQLDEAVRAFMEQHPSDKLTVVVDATFGHRIDDAEKQLYEEAVAAGELITPPAGAIGRGDAFVLEIADRADAIILSNDSFQEFHGQYTWLFDEGRLIGGKPVPHVGWIFLMRTPVRGPTSRRAVREAKGGGSGRARSSKKSARKAAASTAPSPSTPSSPPPATRKRDSAPKASTGTGGNGNDGNGNGDGAGKGRGRGRRRGRTAEKAFEPYNQPLPFIEFVGAHPVGSEVAGEVERFSSHGAYVMADGARCYIPLRAMADPAPRSAKEVLNLGETRVFVVQSIDTPRRGIDLALPGFAEPEPAAEPTAGAPAAQVDEATSDEIPVAQEPTEEERVTPAKKAPARKAATKKAAAKKAPAKKAAAKKTAVKKAPAKKAAAKKAVAKKTTAKKAVKKTATKKAAAKKTTAKKATKKAATKKAAARKAPAKKAAAKKTTAKKAAKRR